MEIIVVTYPIPNRVLDMIQTIPYDYIVAVEKAATFLHNQGIDIDLVVGDFDSIEDQSILMHYKNEKLNVKKDDTDTLHAIKVASKLKAKKIHLLGGIGGERIEHGYANLLLLDKFKNLEIRTDYTRIYSLSKGNHIIDYKGYISIFAFKKSLLDLSGFEYSSKGLILNRFDTIGISNELKSSNALINVKKGKIIVFETQK